MKGRYVLLPLISALFLTIASCSDKYYVYDDNIWGTTCHIVYDGDRLLDDDIRAQLDSIDAEFSLFNPQSTLRAVNEGRLDSVSRRFAELIDISSKVNAISGGVYDPTIAPLTELWGFGAVEMSTFPDDAVVDSVLESVGIAWCRVDSTGHLIRKSPDTRFDFGSIAKGYGVDMIGRLFESKDVDNYMIEIGGEVLARGVSPHGRPWRIQIDSPEGGLSHSRLTVKELGPERRALATSGNYRNYRVNADGCLYGHTLSPLTGRPVVSEVLSATVMADDCALADALATACMASACSDSAMALLRRAGVAGLIVTGVNDSLVVLSTADF